MDRKQKIGARIKQARLDLSWSQRDLAKLYKCSDVTISEIERGITDVSVPGLEKFADILGKPFDWFRSDEVESPDRPVEAILAELQQKLKYPAFRRIPLLGNIPCGYPLPNEQQASGNVTVCIEDLGFAKDKPGLFALVASGDSMIGDGIQNGDKLIIDPDVSDHPDGRIYAVRIEDEVTCKHVAHTDGKVKLISSNSHYKEKIYNADQVQLMGRLILWGNWHKI